MGRCILRVEFNGVRFVRYRVVIVSLLVIDIAAILVSTPIIGRKFDGLIVVWHSPVIIAFENVCQPTVSISICKVDPEFDSLVEVLDGVIIFMFLCKGQCASIVSIGIIRFQADCLLVIFYCLVVVALVVIIYTMFVKRFCCGRSRLIG